MNFTVTVRSYSGIIKSKDPVKVPLSGLTTTKQLIEHLKAKDLLNADKHNYKVVSQGRHL